MSRRLPDEPESLDLFGDRPAPREELPPFSNFTTSLDAAKAIKPVTGVLRLRVLDFIRSQGAYGATDDEIEINLMMKGSTVRPRRGELIEAGAVVNSGRRRATRTGNKAIVWIAASFQSTEEEY